MVLDNWGEPSAVFDAQQADTNEKLQLKKCFWYHHQNAGPNLTFPFTYTPAPAPCNFLPSLAISTPACLLQQQCNSVKRVMRLTFFALLNLCCPTDWLGIQASTAGQQLINGGRNTRTHAHTNSCINRH